MLFKYYIPHKIYNIKSTTNLQVQTELASSSYQKILSKALKACCSRRLVLPKEMATEVFNGFCGKFSFWSPPPLSPSDCSCVDRGTTFFSLFDIQPLWIPSPLLNTLKLIYPYGYFRHHLIWHFSRFKPTLMGQGTRDRRTILIYTVAAYTWCVNTSSILFTNVIMEFDDDDTDIFDWLADIVSHGLSTC